MSLHIVCTELATAMHWSRRVSYNVGDINLEKTLIIVANRLESKALEALCLD